MPFCGPKLSLCGVILSAWGIVQLVSDEILKIFLNFLRIYYNTIGKKTRELKRINFTEICLDIFRFLKVKFYFLWKIFKKKFREIDLVDFTFDFTSFFGLNFLKFSGLL